MAIRKTYRPKNSSYNSSIVLKCTKTEPLFCLLQTLFFGSFRNSSENNSEKGTLGEKWSCKQFTASLYMRDHSSDASRPLSLLQVRLTTRTVWSNDPVRHVLLLGCQSTVCTGLLCPSSLIMGSFSPACCYGGEGRKGYEEHSKS